MRLLGIVLSLVGGACVVAIGFLTYVVPLWIQEAQNADRAIGSFEKFLFMLSGFATANGLVAILLALLLLGVSAALIALHRKPERVAAE